ncbi:MAG TPA: alpha/beta hydrolase [Acidimicrobiia bacterium]|nr:alpha/beta hydrolase [Acidimicrobiia bacterium]
MLVSWLFLAVSVWGALWTLTSFRPPHRPGWLMVVGFFAAWSTTELAPLHLVWQLLATVVFIALGALEYWPGWLALGITLVSWAGLATSVRGSLQTDRAFAEGLRDALGAHWDAALEPALETPGRDVRWNRILLPFKFKRKGVTRVRNIQYVDGGRKREKRRHRLDVYRRADVGPGAPVLLQIHGGAWMIGNKNQQGLPLMYHLAANGWVCVAINYRLSPRATWPDQLIDCKRALVWVREHITEHRGDPGFVVVTGGSAGGHLTALMGLTANDPEYQPGFEHVDTSVQAMIPFYGVFDWTASGGNRNGTELREVLERYIVKQPFADARAVYERASPVFRVRADAPPALVIHGDLDTLAPVEDARTFVAKLRATSHEPVVYVELEGAHHAFEVFNSIRTMHAIAGVDLFLAWLLSAASRSGASPHDAADPSRTS